MKTVREIEERQEVHEIDRQRGGILESAFGSSEVGPTLKGRNSKLNTSSHDHPVHREKSSAVEHSGEYSVAPDGHPGGCHRQPVDGLVALGSLPVGIVLVYWRSQPASLRWLLAENDRAHK